MLEGTCGLCELLFFFLWFIYSMRCVFYDARQNYQDFDTRRFFPRARALGYMMVKKIGDIGNKKKQQ
jgi:hypothetical protein